MPKYINTIWAHGPLSPKPYHRTLIKDLLGYLGTWTLRVFVLYELSNQGLYAQRSPPRRVPEAERCRLGPPERFCELNEGHGLGLRV